MTSRQGLVCWLWGVPAPHRGWFTAGCELLAGALCAFSNLGFCEGAWCDSALRGMGPPAQAAYPSLVLLSENHEVRNDRTSAICTLEVGPPGLGRTWENQKVQAIF